MAKIKIINDNDKEVELQISEESYSETVKQAGQITGKRWIPNKRGTYFVINEFGACDSHTWKNDLMDKTAYSMSNVFQTKAEVGFEIQKRKLLVEMQDWANEHNDNSQQARSFLQGDAICFTSSTLANQAIDKFGDRYIKYVVNTFQGKGE